MQKTKKGDNNDPNIDMLMFYMFLILLRNNCLNKTSSLYYSQSYAAKLIKQNVHIFEQSTPTHTCPILSES